MFARTRCNIVQPSPFAVFRWRVPCSGDHTGVSVTPLGERVVCSATVVHLGSSLLKPNARGAADERREKERGWCVWSAWRVTQKSIRSYRESVILVTCTFSKLDTLDIPGRKIQVYELSQRFSLCFDHVRNGIFKIGHFGHS